MARDMALSQKRRLALKVINFAAVSTVCLLIAVPAQGQNIDMGATYRALDAQTVQVTTQFQQAVATTERTPNGNLTTTLHSLHGDLLGSLVVPSAGSISFTSPDLASGVASIEAPDFVPSTDWANLQVMSLWRDLRSISHRQGIAPDATQLAWDGPFVRPWQSSPLSGSQSGAHGNMLEREALSVTSVYETTLGVEIVAISVRELSPTLATNRSGETFHGTFTTEVHNQVTGERLGIMRWFEEPRVFTWSFPGLTEGWADPARQQQAFPFEPDLAWGNVQALAFWQAHSEQALVPSQIATKALALKDTEGCDGLHWLDDTVYRPCCDDHDRCYEKNGCTASSWWLVGTSWSCIRCNLEVVWCFISTFFGGPGGGGGGGGGGATCTVSGAEWCPPECISCTRMYY